MNDIVARLRDLSARSGFTLAVGAVAAVTLAAAAWVAIPARREAAALSAEAARLQAVVASSNAWMTSFQPASSDESALWQNTSYEIQALGVRPSERLSLAQIIARKADESGLVATHIRFVTVDTGGQPPPRQVAGVSFNPAQYRLQLTGSGGFAALNALIGGLPPAVDMRSAALTLDSNGTVNTSLTLSVFEPAGANGK